MNALVNKVQLLGRLGNDPEVQDLDNGSKLTKFSLATNETYKDASGKRVENTQWHHIVAWGPMAERAEKILKKGRQVALEGKLVSSSYTDKEGVKRYQTDIHLSEFLVLDKKPDQP